MLGRLPINDNPTPEELKRWKIKEKLEELKENTANNLRMLWTDILDYKREIPEKQRTAR